MLFKPGKLKTIKNIIGLEKNKNERKDFKEKNTFQKILTLTILFPLGYCLLDGLGTFLDGIYLDKLQLIGEATSLIAYEYTFALYGLITFIYLKLKKESFSIIKEKISDINAIISYTHFKEHGSEKFILVSLHNIL